MSVPTLNEGSTCWIKAKFYDHNQAVQTPTEIQYKVECETTGQVLSSGDDGWVVFPTDSTIEIQISAELNGIINNGNPVERKVVTIKANSDVVANAFVEVQRYDVINLQAIS